MRFQNVIGAKYLYLYPGSSGPVLRPGATIPLSQSVESADVGDFLTDVGAFLKALNPNDVNTFTEAIVASLQNNDVQVNQLIANTATVSGSVGALDTHVASVIDNLEQVLASLAARNSDLVAVTDHLASVAQQLAARNDVLDSLVGNFGEVNRDLNALLGANRGNLDQTIANLQKIAAVLAQHHADLNADLATLSSGLAPYTLISAFGQWFEIRVVYSCLARQTSCSYDTPTSGGASPGPSGSASGVASIVNFALGGRAS
jgi:phospholipid/cholesterol/gamma-HCH transport system substrate-binding protein